MERLTIEDLKQRLRDDPEAAAYFAEVRRHFVLLAQPESESAWFVHALNARLAEAFPSFRPPSDPEAMFDYFLATGLELANLILPWWEAKSSAVARAGLIVPISQRPLELGGLLRAHRDGGDEGTIAYVREMYDRLFAEPQFLTQLKEQWRVHPLLGKRIAPLSHALDAHAAGLYGASIPALIAQLEGAIADTAPPGTMSVSQWLARMKAATDGDPITGMLVQQFISDVLAAPFQHGMPIASSLSRHAILHGGDHAYGTEQNSRTMILFVDYFAFVTRLKLRAEHLTTAGTP